MWRNQPITPNERRCASHLTSHSFNLTGDRQRRFLMDSLLQLTHRRSLSFCARDSLISRFTLSRSVRSWCHFYHYVLHQGLIALQTVIADRAKDVEFRHVTHRGPPRQVIRNGMVATH